MKIDRRRMPAYSVAEAAHYLGVSAGKIRFWCLGGPYPTTNGERIAKPVIELPDRGRSMLSFLNLAEVHILDGIRIKHRVALQRIRPAIEYVKKQFRVERPLLQQIFQTDGVDLFVEKYGSLINISKDGQTAMRQILLDHLHRIEYDEKGLVQKLFPFTRAQHSLDDPKVIVIDPEVSFGRPVLAGTGISTAIVAERYKAGDSIEDLAKDYRRSTTEIEDAIRSELLSQAA